MPFLGSRTLRDVVSRVKKAGAVPARGEFIAEPLRPTAAEPAPFLDQLAGVSYAEAVLMLVARVADGLAHAHEHDIIHHDIKPANVLLADTGLPLLLDFNVARDLSQTSVFVASLGGTLPYMAPEHLRSFRGVPSAVDARGDVFALGVVLYELLTGRMPFHYEQPEHAAELLELIEVSWLIAPADPCRFNPDITPAVVSILMKCLDPDPAKRYANGRELHDDLHRQLTHQPLKTRVGQVMEAEVLVNDGYTQIVQVANATPGATYFVEVSAADPDGPRNVGNYFLGVDFSPIAYESVEFASGELTDEVDA